MADPLPQLIDKLDGFEVVRDQIAAILAINTTTQQALALAGGKDPELWAYKVYSERRNPWEQFLNLEDSTATDQTPIVSVWYTNASYEAAASNTVKEQKCEGIFYVDIYALGLAQDNPSGGQIPGDLQASLNAQRILRLVRNTLMSAQNTYLQLRGTVWHRWIQSIELFQPAQDERTVQQMKAIRIALRVDFTETAPQIEGQPLELLNVEVKRDPDGLVLATAQYDFTD